MELLCIKSHKQGAVIAGYTYPFIRESKGQPDACDCQGDKGVDVGVIDDEIYYGLEKGERINVGDPVRCATCHKEYIFSRTWWISKELFGMIATEEEVKSNQQEYELQRISTERV